MGENVVVLRVQLDESKTEERLRSIVLETEATRKAQQALTAERKAGKVTDEAFALQTVALRTQLKNQQAETAALTKNLTLYRSAVNGVSGSYDQMQAQLTLAQRQFRGLKDSADNSTEATQALSSVVRDLRGTLKQTDASGLDQFFRSVGDYKSGNFEALVQQLVKLQEEQKNLTEGTKEYAETQVRVAGFQTQAMQTAAMQGKTYEETTDSIQSYSASIRPAVVALVQLEQEQAKVAAGSEAFNQIGFKIQQARKQIQEVPSEVKGVGDTLTELDSTTNLFGGRVSNLKQQFAQAKQGIELARGGFTGLKGAIAGTGIGVFILALGALYSYFTQTDEGAEDLAAGLAFLKGLFAPLGTIAIGTGKALVTVFTDPKKAAGDLIDFLESQVMNRIKAFGVVWDGIRNGDFKQVAYGLLQYQTGVEDVIGKTQNLAAESMRAAEAARDISRAKDALEDKEIEAIRRNEIAKQQAEKLVATAKDRTLSEAQRLANLDKAGNLETEVLKRTMSIEDDKLDIIRRENAERAKTGKLQDDERRQEEEQAARVVQLQGEYETRQQQIQNRRSVLLQQDAAEQKALAEKEAARRLEIRRSALELEGQLLDRQLRTVKANSNEEMSILQQKLRNGYQLELAVKGLTIGQKKLADARYESESLKLTQEFNKARILSAYDDAVAANAAELVAVKKGTDAETELRREAIDTQLRKELAALDIRRDNAAQEALLRANAAKALNDVNYGAALAKLDAYLDAQRAALEEANAKGLLSEKQYADAVIVSDQLAAGSRLQLARDFKQDTAALEKQATAAKIAGFKAVTAADKAEHAKRVAAAQELAGSLTALFAETVATTGATLQDFARKALVLLIDSVEKSIIAAEIKILAEAFASADSIATFGAAGGFKAALIIGAVTAVSEGLKAKLTTPPQQFALGTVLRGPSHASGGIQLFSRSGYHFGEAEGGEPILTAGVSRNPALLAAASALNVAAGGRPLVPSAYMALGGIASPAVREAMRGEAGPIDYELLAQATARALRKSPPITRVIDVKAGIARQDYTEGQANS